MSLHHICYSMHTLLFRYDPVDLSAREKACREFNSVVYAWANDGCNNKLADIFGHDILFSSLVVSQISTVFEIKLTKKQDMAWVLASISSEDLAVAMGLDPLDWTIWTKKSA